MTAERHRVIGDVHLLLTDSDGRVLLGRRANTGYEDGAYHVPSGHLESGESVLDALAREAKEEIGVSIEASDIDFAHVMHNSSSGGRVAFFFRVVRWQGEPSNMEPDKCDDLAWFALDVLPDMMIPYCREALGHITAGREFSLFGW
ncbi:NUDIX domain-containing protein [Nocardia cyriacigeorgica]|uniref:NUDIX domain-containing protein n=1 Tax=Nocardia cyriacigeorgica TaxID=135487 RepID=A0A6P1D1J6_9NOCA|nr:NUDIX domain-containing protein [Nocardia cyriacigeorgica]NEW43419.1 NUDIX domain-containing protein [Nocardia cyriacigeorgica]NEW56561.1 NUDIX domain-containing protein [Nocardia cyriacigeorgica]